MKYCSKCGKELVDEAVICVGCGCMVGEMPKSRRSNNDDEISIGLCVLAFFFPLFGIIYWPVKHEQSPRRARACGIVGIASAVLGMLFWNSMMSIMFRLAGM